jgi:hypothetical protein
MEHIPTYYTPETNFLSMNVRSRREINTRDATNTRRVELWQTDAPYLQMNRPDMNGPKVLSDMNPTNSRSLDSKAYLQNKPMKAGEDSFTKNPYFDGYAPQFDSRNAVRELRSAVYEDHFDKGVRESKYLLGRTFTSQWLEPTYVQDNNLNTLNSLEAYEQLKPQMDDITRSFKSEPGSGKKKNPIKSTSVGRKKTPSPPPKKKEEKKVDTTVLYAR